MLNIKDKKALAAETLIKILLGIILAGIFFLGLKYLLQRFGVWG